MCRNSEGVGYRHTSNPVNSTPVSPHLLLDYKLGLCLGLLARCPFHSPQALLQALEGSL